MEKNEISAEDFETDLLESFHEIIHMYSSTEETVAYFGEIFDLDMSEEQKNQVVYDSLKDLSPVERYKDLYENGELRIRDMRAYAEGLDPSEMSDEEIATALQSAQALREVNASRSVLWRIFHPFRNNAEQRDAKLIEGLISEKITEMQSNHEKIKDFTWYSNFAKTYSPLSEAIDTFGDYVRGVWEDQSEFSDDSNVSEETSQDKVRGNDVMVVSPLKEDEEKNFDNEIKEELNERRSLDIKFENENTDKKSPFIEVNAKDKQVISKDK